MHPPAAGYWQPSTGSHWLNVQAFPSSQVRGGGLKQRPAWQNSTPLQILLSSQSAFVVHAFAFSEPQASSATKANRVDRLFIGSFSPPKKMGPRRVCRLR